MRLRFTILAGAIGATLVWSCAGPDLPDAPNPPRIRHTVPPDFGNDPTPTPSPGSSGGATPSPGSTGTPATLPPAPHGGQLARSGPNYLEFFVDTQNGKTVFFAFPFDKKLQAIKGTKADGTGTYTVDGGASAALTPFETGGTVIFYVYPKLTSGSRAVGMSLTVKGVSYSGTFTYP
ncbi:MAG: hypothetical protein FJZ00_10505 [Candidatus Sericytochromatia bacterium]|uniref:Lipoprotein n=1 Tax=Candidatus Tanganyikabacteria bacterium TaxID=2961651 RepID=A0A937X3V8_9BACT|nr:hypothetical protein [Candidatus Tanganyikabacteria bacterium]